MSPYLWLFLGIVFLGIFIVLLWANFMRKAKRSNRKGVKDFPVESLINTEVHEDLNK